MSLIISTSTPTIIPSLIEYYFYKMNMAWMHLKYIYTTISFHSHQISTWRSLGAKKTIRNFGIIVIILKLAIQYKNRYGMKRVIRPVHLANNIPLQKIQWVSTHKK